jgi:hypothetical protein
MKIKWDEEDGNWALRRPTVWIHEYRHGCAWAVCYADGRPYADGHCPSLAEAQADAIAALKRLEGEA